MPDVSYAVILTRQAERAARAVRSVEQQTPDSELLLVLNEPDDAMRAYARELEAAGARVLHDGVDIGVVFGWNLALREARSEHVCILHEDSELQPGCADRLLRTLRERPDAAAVRPRTLLPGGVVCDGSVVWSDGAISRIVDALPADVHPIDHATSSCVMVSRAAALGVGGFDECAFPAVYADVALSVALWVAGRVVLCDRRAVSVHHMAAMVDGARGPLRGERFRQFLLWRNRARFAETFAGWLATQADRSDAVDAGHPEPAELADALARARERERRVRAELRPPLPDRLVLPDDLEARVGQLRRELERAFVTHLVEHEAALEAEVAELHGGYARLHAELDRVHGEYAAQQAELVRVRDAHDKLHPELERVHKAYAELWEDRRRLLDAQASRLGMAGAERA